MMREGHHDVVELEVTTLAHGGVGVARLEGRVVFVADAIPGERVEARVTDARKKSFWRAETLRVLDASPHRRPHVWAEARLERDPAERAGGADLGHIDLAHQRILKAEVLADALRRQGRTEREVVVEAAPGDDEANGLGWRTRVSLHVGDDGRPGPFASRSHTVVPVTDLPLATPELRRAAPLTDDFTGLETVDVLAPSVGEPRLVLGAQKPTVISERVGEREFRLDDTGFWQVHREAPAVLTRMVQEAIDEELFDAGAANLDLYGGVGLLAAAVGDRFGRDLRITSVESDPRATEHAGENLADWIGARAETGRVDRWLPRAISEASSAERDRMRAATVVLDPPRSGAGRAVVESLAEMAPAQIVYVACDPVALARDIALLAEQGYALGLLRAVDLFPHTHHLEAVATFTRADA